MTIFHLPKDTIEFLVSLLPVLDAVRPEDFNQDTIGLCLSGDGNVRRKTYACCGCVLYHGFPQLKKYLADHPLESTPTDTLRVTSPYPYILKALYLNTRIGHFIFGYDRGIKLAGKALQIPCNSYDVLTANDAANRIKFVCGMIESEETLMIKLNFPGAAPVG